MAENKKSFILYTDLIHTVSKLPNDKAGELFKLILSYVNDENPVSDDLLLSIAFEPIKQQLKRDLRRWEQFIEKQSNNGKLGGRPKKAKESEENPKNPSLISESQKSLNVTVNVNDNVNVIKDDFDLLLVDWFQYKKDKRQSYKSDKSKLACKNKLINLSNNNTKLAAQIIEQSMANNWDGLFPLKTAQVIKTPQQPQVSAPQLPYLKPKQ